MQTEGGYPAVGSEGLQHADQLANLRCHRVIRLRTVCSAGGIVISEGDGIVETATLSRWILGMLGSAVQPRGKLKLGPVP